MARPRTYAPPVAFRLQPDDQEKLEARAVRAGLPLAVYVRDEVTKLLNGDYVPKPKRAPSPNGAKKKTRSRATSAA